MSISQNKLLCTFKKYILKVLCMMSSEYVHIKTGNKYKVLFISNEHSGRAGFPRTVVYVSEDGVIYSRPLVEFRDKFETVGSPKIFPI